MIVHFAFANQAWENAAVRHTTSVVATLLGWPWRMAPVTVPAPPDDAVVFVGSASETPAAAAAVVTVEDGPPWSAATLTLSRFEGEPLPCPGGRIHVSGDPRVLPPEWLRAIAHALSREEEFEDTSRDQWGCFSGFQSRLHAIGVLDSAFVNRQARALSRRIETHAARRGATLEPLPLWPGGARFAAALTHDIDDLTMYSFRNAWRLLLRARSPRDYALRAGLGGMVRAARNPGQRWDPYWNLDEWMNAAEQHGFRSTFFVLPPRPSRRHPYDGLYDFGDRVGYRGRIMPFRDVLKSMVGRGHEVGLHGSYESHRDAAELARQRAQIEVGSGAAAAGIRQHFLRFDIADTWREQAAAGFTYDTTLGYNETPGFRAGIAAPFRPWNAVTGEAAGILELPLSVMDGALFRSLGLNESAAARRLEQHLDEVEECGGLAVLLWHPNAAAQNQFPGWWPVYRAALDLLAARRAWVATAGEIAAHWRLRCVAGERSTAGAGP